MTAVEQPTASRAERAGGPRSYPLRLLIALGLGRVARGLSRRAGTGAGGTIGGRVAMAVAPDALHRLTMGRRVTLVTGTNGKSTTTRLVVAAFGRPVCSNITGANLPAGLVNAMLDCRADTAVFETDELYLPRVLAETRPEVVVLLNLSRDQLDRTHEVRRVAAAWREALAAHPPRLVVANAADPHIVAAARGMDPVWVLPPAGWTQDSVVCPDCGALLERDDAGWRCTCGLRQPEADLTIDGTDIVLASGQRLPASLSLPGSVNVGNAAFALATAHAFGIGDTTALARIATVHDVAGRYSWVELAGRQAQLLLAKNPAGWASALEMLAPDHVLAIGVNARSVDGRDTSWLWDVPFEVLAGRQVGAFGERASDLALRLNYAGAEPVIARTPAELMHRLPPGPVTVLANYTAFQEVRKHVA